MLRKLFFIITTAILVVAVFTGIVSALDVREPLVIKTNLENVGSFATATHVTGINYAVDNGELFAGRPGEWRKIAHPRERNRGRRGYRFEPAQRPVCGRSQ